MEAEADFMFAPRARPADAVELSLDHCVGVAGCLHIIHNSSADLESAMLYYNDVVSKLKNVSNLLRRQHTKDRCLRTCFNDPPLCYMKADIKSFKARVYTNR